MRTVGTRRERPCAHRFPDAREVDPKHVAVQEQERAERLVLRGRGDVALHGHPGEERLDLAGAQLARVPLAVVHHELYTHRTYDCSVRRLKCAAARFTGA